MMATITQEQFKARLMDTLTFPVTGEGMAMAINLTWRYLKDDGLLMSVEINQENPEIVTLVLTNPDRVFGINVGE